MSCGAQTTKPIKIYNVSFTMYSLRLRLYLLVTKVASLFISCKWTSCHGLVQNDKAVNWLLGDRVIGLSLMHLIVFSSEENHPKPKLHLWTLSWITISEEGSCKHVCHS